jgi:hypothetical protein
LSKEKLSDPSLDPYFHISEAIVGTTSGEKMRGRREKDKEGKKRRQEWNQGLQEGF